MIQGSSIILVMCNNKFVDEVQSATKVPGTIFFLLFSLFLNSFQVPQRKMQSAAKCTPVKLFWVYKVILYIVDVHTSSLWLPWPVTFGFISSKWKAFHLWVFDMGDEKILSSLLIYRLIQPQHYCSVPEEKLQCP